MSKEGRLPGARVSLSLCVVCIGSILYLLETSPFQIIEVPERLRVLVVGLRGNRLNAKRLLLRRKPLGPDIFYNVAVSAEVPRALMINKMTIMHMQ